MEADYENILIEENIVGAENHTGKFTMNQEPDNTGDIPEPVMDIDHAAMKDPEPSSMHLDIADQDITELPVLDQKKDVEDTIMEGQSINADVTLDAAMVNGNEQEHTKEPGAVEAPDDSLFLPSGDSGAPQEVSNNDVNMQDTASILKPSEDPASARSRLLAVLRQRKTIVNSEAQRKETTDDSESDQNAWMHGQPDDEVVDGALEDE